MNERKRKIVFATNNQHKLEEARGILSEKFEVVSLKEIGCNDDIPETGTTLKENAFIKAKWVSEKYGYSCFSDDTGLEVEALEGRPGVYSARYAGEECSSEKNIHKLLSEMKGMEHRDACFRTVIAYIENGEEFFFEGKVEGKIIEERRGSSGFGYDSVFVPKGKSHTFAELSGEEKNRISHRGKALRAFSKWLMEREDLK